MAHRHEQAQGGAWCGAPGLKLSPQKRPPCVEAMLQYKEDPKLHQESPWQQYDQNRYPRLSTRKKMGGHLKMSGLDVITSRWMAMKKGCKAKLADWLKLTMDLEIDQDALIDIQSLGIFISNFLAPASLVHVKL